MSAREISRRELFRRGGLLGALLAWPGRLPGEAAAGPAAAPVAPASAGLRLGPGIYQSIGVRPLINARGTYTIISGSTLLPEVRAAMEAAAQRYVHLDELTEAVGVRLAALTGAEWGSSPTAARGPHPRHRGLRRRRQPDLHVRIPNLSGFPRDEAIIPKHSRNVYDAALRAVGVRVIEVTTPAELEAAFGPRTALCTCSPGPRPTRARFKSGSSPPRPSSRRPRPRRCRGRRPDHPQRAPAGGRDPRGLQRGEVPARPAGSGPAARAQGPGQRGLGPQRAPSRLRPGPESGQGRGDRDAHGRGDVGRRGTTRPSGSSWTSWLDAIAEGVSTIDGVTTSVDPPEGLSNRTPYLRFSVGPRAPGMSGDTAARTLFETDPRVGVFAIRGEADTPRTGSLINPYMLAAGEERIVADRLHGLLSNLPERRGRPPRLARSRPHGSVGRADRVRGLDLPHTLSLRQRKNDIDGAHGGEFVSRDLMGTIDGDAVRSVATTARGTATP